MIKMNILCGMALARKTPEQVGAALARAIDNHRKTTEDEEMEEAAITELLKPVKRDREMYLDTCIAYDYVKDDLSLVVCEDNPRDPSIDFNHGLCLTDWCDCL